MRHRFLIRIAVLGCAALVTSAGVATATSTFGTKRVGAQVRLCVNMKSGKSMRPRRTGATGVSALSS